MEPIIIFGGIIVVLGGIWTVLDLLQDVGFSLKTWVKDNKRKLAGTHQVCSGFKSRDISSSTACRAGLSQ